MWTVPWDVIQNLDAAQETLREPALNRSMSGRGERKTIEAGAVEFAGLPDG